jgi:hypothetical protein
MHRRITIRKAATSDKVLLDPSPLQIVGNSERPNGGGRVRIDIVADQSLQLLSTADKSVVFNFGDAPASPSPFPHQPFEASAQLHDAPPPGAGSPITGPPFTLRPGQTLTLTVRDTGLRPIAQRTGPSPTRFVLDGEGHPNSSFTLTASLRFSNRERDGAGHTDLHMEC